MGIFLASKKSLRETESWVKAATCNELERQSPSSVNRVPVLDRSVMTCSRRTGGGVDVPTKRDKRNDAFVRVVWQDRQARLGRGSRDPRTLDRLSLGYTSLLRRFPLALLLPACRLPWQDEFTARSRGARARYKGANYIHKSNSLHPLFSWLSASSFLFLAFCFLFLWKRSNVASGSCIFQAW